MNATTTVASRLRGFTPDVQRKIIRAEARSAKRQKIERIRTGLQRLVDAGEREWEARRLSAVGGGQHPPRLLIEAINLSADFDALTKELGYDH
jgi:hypothetical protein